MNWRNFSAILTGLLLIAIAIIFWMWYENGRAKDTFEFRIEDNRDGIEVDRTRCRRSAVAGTAAPSRWP